MFGFHFEAYAYNPVSMLILLVFQPATFDPSIERPSQPPGSLASMPPEVGRNILVKTLEPSLSTVRPTSIDDTPDAWLGWLHGWLQLRLVCLGWFWIIDTECRFWDGISEGGRSWKWAALCVELARWKGWSLRQVAFTWSNMPESDYARDVLQTSALLASALDVTLMREIDSGNLLGDLQTFRELESLVLRSGLYGEFEIPFTPQSDNAWGIWKQIERLKELIFVRVHVPLSWLVTATHLRRLHLSWLAYRLADDHKRWKEDIVQFSRLIKTMEGLEELHVEGTFWDGDDTVERVVNPKLRDVRFAGFGRDVWLLLESIEVKDTMSFEVEVRSDGYDGLVWTRVGQWASEWDVCGARLQMREIGPIREREFEITALPERTDGKMTVTKGQCGVKWRGRRDAGGDMVLVVVDVLKACGSMDVEEVRVGPLPANVEVSEDAWMELMRLSPKARVLQVEWCETERPPTVLHPLTRAFSAAGDRGFWVEMLRVELQGYTPEKDVGEWVCAVRQRDDKQEGRLDDETAARWRKEDDTMRLYLEELKRRTPWNERVILQVVEPGRQWVVSMIQ